MKDYSQAIIFKHNPIILAKVNGNSITPKYTTKEHNLINFLIYIIQENFKRGVVGTQVEFIASDLRRALSTKKRVKNRKKKAPMHQNSLFEEEGKSEIVGDAKYENTDYIKHILRGVRDKSFDILTKENNILTTSVILKFETPKEEMRGMARPYRLFLDERFVELCNHAQKEKKNFTKIPVKCEEKSLLKTRLNEVLSMYNYRKRDGEIKVKISEIESIFGKTYQYKSYILRDIERADKTLTAEIYGDSIYIKTAS